MFDDDISLHTTAQVRMILHDIIKTSEHLTVTMNNIRPEVKETEAHIDYFTTVGNPSNIHFGS